MFQLYWQQCFFGYISVVLTFSGTSPNGKVASQRFFFFFFEKWRCVTEPQDRMENFKVSAVWCWVMEKLCRGVQTSVTLTSITASAYALDSYPLLPLLPVSLCLFSAERLESCAIVSHASPHFHTLQLTQPIAIKSVYINIFNTKNRDMSSSFCGRFCSYQTTFLGKLFLLIKHCVMFINRCHVWRI